MSRLFFQLQKTLIRSFKLLRYPPEQNPNPPFAPDVFFQSLSAVYCQAGEVSLTIFPGETVPSETAMRLFPPLDSLASLFLG